MVCKIKRYTNPNLDKGQLGPFRYWINDHGIMRSWFYTSSDFKGCLVALITTHKTFNKGQSIPDKIELDGEFLPSEEAIAEVARGSYNASVRQA